MANYSPERFRKSHATLAKIIASALKGRPAMTSEYFDVVSEFEDLMDILIPGLYFQEKRCLRADENGLYKVQIVWSLGVDRTKYDTSLWFTKDGEYVRRSDFGEYTQMVMTSLVEKDEDDAPFEEVEYDEDRDG